MTVDQALFLLEFLLPQLESEQAVTQRILLSVPPEQESYRPNPKGKSAFELARHIATTEFWLLDAVIDRRFSEIANLSGSVTTCAQVAEWYAENRGRRLPVLKKLSGEELVTPVDFIGLRHDPAVAYLNIAIRHSVHHRGQLSAYLRAMGARVPAIYVESADEPYPGDEPVSAAYRPPAF